MKNKNHIIIVALLFGFLIHSNSSIAQSEVGVKGGILFSNIKTPGNNSNVEIEKRNGVTLGAFYKKENILGPVGFQTELLYQQKGANYFIESDITAESNYPDDYISALIDASKSYYRSNEKLHYLTVPLLLEVNTAKFLDIYAGPELGYLISQKTNRQETDELSRFSAGIVMGATLKLCENTSLDFRYSTDFTAFDKLGRGSSVEMKNEGFTITIQHTIFIKQNK
jgi:hypothetical protein